MCQEKMNKNPKFYEIDCGNLHLHVNTIKRFEVRFLLIVRLVMLKAVMIRNMKDARKNAVKNRRDGAEQTLPSSQTSGNASPRDRARLKLEERLAAEIEEGRISS